MTSTTVATSNRHTVLDSPIGALTVVRTDDGLTGVYFPGHWTRPDRSAFGPQVEQSAFADVHAQLAEYFAGDRRDFELSLAPRGSSTACRVWQLIAQIPYGQTTTYGALAAQVGAGTTAQEVGGFVGRNPLSIIVGCHRVIGSNGKLTGYAGGLQRKRFLLELESARAGSAPGLW